MGLARVNHSSRPPLRRVARRVYDRLRGVRLLGPVFRAVDRLHLRLVAQERYEGGEAGRDYLEQYAAALLSLTRGKVLDLGCGHGYLTIEIARRSEVTEVVGIDKIAEFRCVHPKIGYRTQDLAADPGLPGRFDVVLATEFIEHIPEAAFLRLLPAIRAALSNGGLFVGSTPINPTRSTTFSKSPYHLREYQPDVLRACLERDFAGVVVEEHNASFMTWTAWKPQGS